MPKENIHTNQDRYKKQIVVSFSGGRTSAFMAHCLIEKHGKENVHFVFANTGIEHENTLVFINECDKRWDLGLVWLEAEVVHEQRVGTKYKIVDFESASRKGEPFEDMCVKYGLPNQKYPHCTRELKERPISKWLKDKFTSKEEYSLAIGIRADEIDRVNLVHMKTRSLIYPLADSGKTKRDVENFWGSQPFILNLPEHYGNCVTCFKKSDRKLMTIAQDDPKWFSFMAMIGNKYKYTNSKLGRPIFRGNLTALMMIGKSMLTKFERFSDKSEIPFNPEFDLGGGCGNGCEVFSD